MSSESPTLQETLDRFHQSFQDSFGFSLSKLFLYDVSQEKLAGLMQDHKVMREKDIRVCPKLEFFDGAWADLRFQTQ